MDFILVPAETCPTEEILAVMSSAFQRDFDEGWYDWKHRHGPWGPSTGWAACDAAGVVGVRLFVPWVVRYGDKRMVIGRAMDGAVAQRAQRQGIFSALVRQEMRRQAEAGGWALLSSTSVPASTEAYRRLSWTILPPLATGWRAPTRGLLDRTRVVLGDALDHLEPEAHETSPTWLQTDWTPKSLRWRLDPRSGHTYEVARLVNADSPNGVAFRITQRHRLRTMVLVHSWGTVRERSRLVGAVAARLRCALIVESCGPGTQQERQRLLLRRLSTTVSVWPTLHYPPDAPPAVVRSSWRQSLGDLEGVM